MPDPARLVRVWHDIVQLAPAVERPFDEKVDAGESGFAQQRIDPSGLHGHDVVFAPKRVVVIRQGAFGAQKEIVPLVGRTKGIRVLFFRQASRLELDAVEAVRNGLECFEEVFFEGVARLDNVVQVAVEPKQDVDGAFGVGVDAAVSTRRRR